MKLFMLALFISYFSLFPAFSQTIDNVFAKVQDNNIVVSYHLKNTQNGQNFDTELWYSIDQGSFKKCESINFNDGLQSGAAGINKNITWFVLHDLGSLECKTLDFEVRAYESLANNRLTVASGRFIDNRDSYNYKWIQIGSQTIMAENLVYKPRSGNYWAYNDEQENIQKYGYLYDWETAKKVCPTGWHLPSKEEFETMLQNFGGGGSNAYSSLIPGGQSQFSALMAGMKFYAGNYLQMGSLAYFWTSSSYSGTDGWDLYIYKSHTNAAIGHYNKDTGFSVRYFKD